MAPDAPDVVEDTLLCRVDVLSRRTMDPERTGRGPVEVRVATAPRPSLTGGSIAATGRLSAVILLVPLAENGFWRSLEDVEMLLWRSSKLGEGKKSKDPVGLSSAPPKEKRLWLLRRFALRVTSLVEATRGLAVGSKFSWLPSRLAGDKQTMREAQLTIWSRIPVLDLREQPFLAASKRHETLARSLPTDG